MSEKLKLFVPEGSAPASAPVACAKQRKLDKRGIRLGVLDNSKGNADHLLALITEGVQAALPISSVVSLRKPHAGAGAPAAMIDHLAKEADCVLSAMAD